MKKIIFMLFIVIGLFSCNEDVLDIPQRGVLALDEYTAADDEQVSAFIAAVYSKLHGNVYDDRFAGTSSSLMAVRCHLGRMGGEFADYYPFTETAESSTYKKIWSYYYSTIYWCNMIIEYLPDNNIASPEIINRVIAEARTIRAITMMQLVQLWGNPPLADHILTGEEGNTPAEESWSFIESELMEAAEGLPSKNGLDGQASIGGRLTKEAAFAFLGKAYLWQNKYNEAANILYTKVIATGLYELVDDYSAMNSSNSDFCKEYLWESEISSNPDYALSQAGYMDVVYNWSNSGLYFPEGIYDGVGWASVSCASESFGDFMVDHDDINGSKSDRYIGTLATYEDLLDETLFSYPGGEKGVKTAGVIMCEGYFRIKLLPRWENVMGQTNWYDQYLHNNIPFMRYSEVLLNYAEAVAMGGNPGAMSGLEALNLVRNRAGLANAPQLDMENSEYGVKAERRAELFFEGTRFIDLVRWGDAVDELGEIGSYNPTFYGYVDGNNATPQGKENWKIVKNAQLSNGFKANKNELFPIPAVDVNNNPNLTQNQGW